MPCNIGVSASSKITLPSKAAQEFKDEIAAPQIDEDLLSKIGEDDPTFLDWLKGLDIVPLLEEALRRARGMMPALGIEVAISSDGRLAVSGKYKNSRERERVEAAVNSLSACFKMQVLAIAAQLLDYSVSLGEQSRGRNAALVLEGEKQSASGPTRRFRVSKDISGNGLLVFEHFESQKELSGERNKFLALCQKLGVKIFLEDEERGGRELYPKTIEQQRRRIR